SPRPALPPAAAATAATSVVSPRIGGGGAVACGVLNASVSTPGRPLAPYHALKISPTRSIPASSPRACHLVTLSPCHPVIPYRPWYFATRMSWKPASCLSPATRIPPLFGRESAKPPPS